MNKEEFVKEIKKYEKEMNFEFNDDQIEKFYNYMKLLLEWNEKVNLTAIVEPTEIILKHFIDSITINKYVRTNGNVLDVGTGAGFPGIPLKIIRPDLNITLVDSLNKRINFLNIVIEELGLEQIKAIHSRVEDIGKDREYREKYDVVTSRAVANLSTLSEYLIPLCKINGIIIAMKGSDIEEEIIKSKKAIKILGGEIKEINKLILPFSDNKRNLIIINKINKTPNIYPRKSGLPSKEPIK